MQFFKSLPNKPFAAKSCSFIFELPHLTMRITCVAAALASRGKATRMVSCVQTPPLISGGGGLGRLFTGYKNDGLAAKLSHAKTTPPAAQVTMREMASIEPPRRSRIVQRC